MMAYIDLVIQWTQEHPRIVFWAMNITLCALYLLALYNMAVKPPPRDDKLTHWNYRFNGFCLAAGLTCLALKVLSGTLDLDRPYRAFEFGDSLFFWAYLISSVLDIIEHSLEFKREKSKGSLFKILKSAGMTVYKFFKTPMAVKKLTTFTFYGFATKATRTAAYMTTLYATADLLGMLFISFLLVLGAHTLGLKRLNADSD
ncbi:MAG: hypothetical protein AAF702_42585 [Chloroflexota bacterium]